MKRTYLSINELLDHIVDFEEDDFVIEIKNKKYTFYSFDADTNEFDQDKYKEIRAL
jgi:hypothetical protein